MEILKNVFNFIVDVLPFAGAICTLILLYYFGDLMFSI